MTKQRGFTLVEVLISLSIVAFSLVALMRSNSQTIGNFNMLKEKTLADIIISNLAIEVRLSSKPAIGIRDDEYKMAGKTWFYSAKTTQMELVKATRTVISLYGDKDAKSNKKPISEIIVYLPTANSVENNATNENNASSENNQ
jgi:type II secretion system protein I